MELFDRQFDEIRDYLHQMRAAGKTREMSYARNIEWPSGNNRNLVLAGDTAVELGNPRDESISLLLWTNDSDKIKDSRITLVGPDLQESVGKRLPFGKIVFIGGSLFNADNAYDRYRELEGIRYDMDLKGYMMRAVSQYQREWSRVSWEAIRNGLSFVILGSALIERLREKQYVSTVEVIFVTSSPEDVLSLKGIGTQAAGIINAMNKMAEEMSFDCDTCEYIDVCSDVTALRSMRDALVKRRMTQNG